jgi:SAM-dependent methyltransferase
VTIPLAKLGLAMTGIDLTPSFLRKARSAARQEHAAIRFLQADMRRLPFENQFDAVVNWFTSFGYFDDSGNLAAARAAWVALKLGGQFLIETMNKSRLLAHWQSRREQTVSGVRIVNSARIDRTGRIRDTWVLSRGQRVERHVLRIRAFNGSEMRALLRDAGFTDIRLFGHSAEGTGRFTRHSRRFIDVARKPVVGMRGRGVQSRR